MAISKKDLAATDNKFRNVARYIYVRNGRVYGIKWYKGKNIKRAAPMQGSLAINDRGEPTPKLREWVRLFAEQIENQDYVASLDKHAKVPSFEEVIRAYRDFAVVERQKSGRPKEDSVLCAIWSLRRIVEGCGLKMSDRLDMLTGKSVSRWLNAVVASQSMGVRKKAISAYADIAHAMMVFARWARVVYRDDMGWEIPSFDDMPKPRGKAIQVRYVKPDDDLRERTIAWWRGLEAIAPEAWIAVTMMIQFAMRNSDIDLLKWKDLHLVDGQRVLHYVPSKTSVSTGGRGVSWPVSKDLFDRLWAARVDDTYVVPNRSVWKFINASMRQLGWSGSKASYELRKMALDQIYRTQGLERAVQLSGDDTKTLMRYYADPSRVSFVPIEDIYSRS